MLSVGLQWFLSQTGLGASNHLEAGGFVRNEDEEDDYPNIQFHFLPSVVVDHGRKFGSGHAYQVHVGTMRPTSKGWLKLRTKNPFDPMVINPNYLDTDHDRREMRQCVQLARRIFKQKAFDDYRGSEILPGSDCVTDKQLDDFVRRQADSAYHPSCTCKMGPVDDLMSVVDPKTLLVHGSHNLNVVDASIMPSVLSGNLNGPVIMMAEKAADIIMGKIPLTPLNVPVYSSTDKSS
jgi:choline dehydrogenase